MRKVVGLLTSALGLCLQAGIGQAAPLPAPIMGHGIIQTNDFSCLEYNPGGPCKTWRGTHIFQMPGGLIDGAANCVVGSIREYAGQPGPHSTQFTIPADGAGVQASVELGYNNPVQVTWIVGPCGAPWQ